jgi:Translation elongation factors (GTPases)
VAEEDEALLDKYLGGETLTEEEIISCIRKATIARNIVPVLLGSAFRNMKLCGIERFRLGRPVNDDKEDELAQLLKAKDVQVDIDLGGGLGSYDFQASDLGHEYVSLNSDYRS